MGVSMDTFMQALLVERSALDNSNNNNNNNNNDSFSSAAENCVVVVDNARHHAERWSELPRRLRTTLLSNNKDPTRRKQSSKKRNVVRTNSNSSSRSEDRWNPKQERTEGKEAMPAPPSIPQRQQSIEVTGAEALAHMTMMDTSLSHQPPAASHKLCSDVDCTVQKAPVCPQRRGSVEAPKDSPHSVVLQQMGLGEIPRMPERQASDDSAQQQCYFLPPPPITSDTDFDQKQNSSSAPTLLGSFSSSVRRSNASLLDDDDDDDDEDCLMVGSASPNPWNSVAF